MGMEINRDLDFHVKTHMFRSESANFYNPFNEKRHREELGSEFPSQKNHSNSSFKDILQNILEDESPPHS